MAWYIVSKLVRLSYRQNSFEFPSVHDARVRDLTWEKKKEKEKEENGFHPSISVTECQV